MVLLFFLNQDSNGFPTKLFSSFDFILQVLVSFIFFLS